MSRMPLCGIRGCRRVSRWVDPSGVGFCYRHRNDGMGRTVRARARADFCPIFLGEASVCELTHPSSARLSAQLDPERLT